MILWNLTLISWIKKHSKILVSGAILFYTAASTYTLFSNQSFFWVTFNALDRAVRLGFIYFSFFSLATSAIYLTGVIKSNSAETTDGLPLSFKISNGIFIFILSVLSLLTIYTIFLPMLFFASVAGLVSNLRAQARGDTSLTGISVIIYFVTSFISLWLSFILNSFFGSVLYSFVILLLFLSATKSLDFFHFAWTGSTVLLIGLAIFMLINATAPLSLITDQLRLSGDSRFSYRIEIVDRGRDTEHVRLFTSKVETGDESTIILPELSGSLVMKDGEEFGDLVLWEDDRYLLFLDQRMWTGDTNWLAISEIDILAESAQPFSMSDDRELFWLAHDLWFDARFLGGVSNLPSFAEVIQAAELIEQLTGHFCRWETKWFIDSYLHRNDSGLSLVEYVEGQLTEDH